MPGIWLDAGQQRGRDRAVGLAVSAEHLHVDRRRQAEVQDLGHDVGRQERERHAREARVSMMRRSCTYRSLGSWSPRRLTRMSASAGPIGADVLYVRLMPLSAGRRCR